MLQNAFENLSTETKQDLIIAAINAINNQTDALTNTELRASPIEVDTGLTIPPAITGFATSSKQDTGNASLTSIDTKLSSQQTDALTDTELRATPVPVDITNATLDITTSSEVEIKNDSGSPIPVSAANLPLPIGAAIAANQQTDALTDTELRSAPVDVDTGFTQPLTDAQLRATAVPVTANPTVYKTMYDFDAAGTYIYTGEAVPGTSTAAASWRISKVNLDATSGNPTSKLWADGVSTFTKVWTSRGSYAYTA